MYTETTFISRAIAESIKRNAFSDKSILISISTPITRLNEHYYSDLNLNEDAWSKVLKLTFHDAENNSSAKDFHVRFLTEDEIILFTENDAIKIIDFLEENKDNHLRAFVHCDAGISRSAAVSKFIAQIYSLDFPQGYKKHNNLVFSTLLSVYYKKIYNQKSIIWTP